MTDKTESLTDTLAKQAAERFSASAAVEKAQRTWYVPPPFYLTFFYFYLASTHLFTQFGASNSCIFFPRPL